jgi:hypothetical protein
MSSGFFEPNSYDTIEACYYCGRDNTCTESNISYRKLCSEMIPFIFCKKCNKYNEIKKYIPVIVKNRILSRDNSFSITCIGCNRIIYVDISERSEKKWYHMNEFRSLSCCKCKTKRFINLNDIPSEVLKKLEYRDKHMSRK